MNAPTGRKASVSPIDAAMSASDLPNSFAIAVSVITTEEEIERVERPAEEASGDGGSLVAGCGGDGGRGGHWCPGRAASRLPAFRPFHDWEAVVRRAPLPLLVFGFVTGLAAQSSGSPPLSPPAPAVAVLALRFDGEHANVLEPGATAVGRAATSP